MTLNPLFSVIYLGDSKSLFRSVSRYNSHDSVTYQQVSISDTLSDNSFQTNIRYNRVIIDLRSYEILPQALNSLLLFLYPHLQSSSRVIVILPERLYFPHNMVTGILDRLGHYLKIIVQFCRQNHYALKLIFLDEVVDEPHLPASHSLMSLVLDAYSSHRQPIIDFGLIIHPLSLSAITHQLHKLLFSANQSSETLYLRGATTVQAQQYLHQLSTQIAQSVHLASITYRHYQIAQHLRLIPRTINIPNNNFTPSPVILPPESVVTPHLPVDASGRVTAATKSQSATAYPTPSAYKIRLSPLRRFCSSVIRKICLTVLLYILLLAASIGCQQLLYRYTFKHTLFSPTTQKYLPHVNQISYSLASTTSSILPDHVMQFPLKSTTLSFSSRLYHRTDLNLRASNIAADTVNLFGHISKVGESYDLSSLLERLSADLRQHYTASLQTTSNWPPSGRIPDNQFATSPEDYLQASRILSAVSQAVGRHQPLRVLVLLQNNQELRPTGGFIGSVALVTLDRGVMLPPQFSDVYDLDSSLNGHVTPPKDLERTLKETQWFLRDSNWDPDFFYTAQQVKWFYEKETNQTVDLVLAIDLDFIASVLSAVGEAQLSNGQSVNSANLHQLAFQYQNLDYQQNGGVKSDFLIDISQSVYQRLPSLKPYGLYQLALSIFSSARNRHLVLASHDINLERSLILAGISGTINPPTCSNNDNLGGCLADYTYVNEANIGINRVNYYVKRSHQHQVAFSDNLALITHNLEISNTAPSADWPAGPYRAYLRLFIPKASQHQTLVVNGESYDLGQYQVLKVRDSMVVAFDLDIPIGLSSQVTLQYQLPYVINTDHLIYTYLHQKQPGVDASPLTFSLTPPGGMRPSRLPQGVEWQDGSLSFASAGFTDASTSVEFTR